MSGRRTATAAATLLLLAALNGCGQGGAEEGSETTDRPVATSTADATKMKRLVDAAESAAEAAESAAAADGQD